MNVEEIAKLDQLLELEENCTIIDYNIERLTSAGDNYGSLMLKLDIKLQKEEEEIEELHTVAKLIPPNDFIQKVFNTQITFRNEIAFYQKIVPTLKAFQKEKEMSELIDFSPKFYGGRINLSGDDKVDNDAALILENLKASGFVNIDRTIGFDYETTKLIILDLANLHAVPLALKLQKPEVFESNVKKYLAELPYEAIDKMTGKLMKIIDGIDEIKIYKNRVKKAIDEFQPKIKEPFATLIHNDCWVNNTMIRMERNKPMENKLVDFQVCSYGSPARDLIFFLFSSVQNHVLNKHLDFFVKFYHRNFIQILEKLQCETSRFSLNAFYREMESTARSCEFVHAIFMTFPIFAPKGAVKELSDIQLEDFLSMEAETEAHKAKIVFIIKEFVRRNWI